MGKKRQTLTGTGGVPVAPGATVGTTVKIDPNDKRDEMFMKLVGQLDQIIEQARAQEKHIARIIVGDEEKEWLLDMAIKMKRSEMLYRGFSPEWFDRASTRLVQQFNTPGKVTQYGPVEIWWAAGIGGVGVEYHG